MKALLALLLVLSLAACSGTADPAWERSEEAQERGEEAVIEEIPLVNGSEIAPGELETLIIADEIA